MNKNYKKYLKLVYDRIYNWEVLYDLFPMGIWGLFRNSKVWKKIFYNYLKLRFCITNKVSVPFLSFFITTKCTLNCKECCAFVNRYEKENHYKPMTFERFKEELDTVLKAIDQVFVFQLVGGEPLLCKDLPKMISYAASKKQIQRIFITSNCTIPFSDELIKTLKATNTSVEISLYKHAAGVKQHYYEIKDMLKQNKIRYSGWIEKLDCGFSRMQSIYEDSENACAYLNCFASKCNTVCDNKFYLCPAAVYIDRNRLGSVLNDEVINLSAVDLQQKLVNFYSKDTHKMCTYCHFDNSSTSVAGEQQLETRSAAESDSAIC